jgi:MFS family permease
MRLLAAGFMAILAAGVGAAIRGGILDNWGAEFGFSATQLGLITGSGFTGFCFGIIIGGIIADKIGYGKLVLAAFILHVISALTTLAAIKGMPVNQVYWILWIGTFIFAVANGTLEAVANPLVATLFPHNRTHYLNILHASWPAGLVLGGAAGWVLDDALQVGWKVQLALFMLPTLVYGAMFFGQSMPKSEASARGLTLGQMFQDVGMLGGAVVCFLISLFFGSLLQPMIGTAGNFVGYAIGAVLWMGVAGLTGFSLGSVLLFVLFVTHALVGAVELGTDAWIQNITGNILSSSEGKILFVFTSMTMFLLRFCADFIEKKIGLSPVGILLVCAILACLGLNLTSHVNTFAFALVALTVYGIGKTFFWPTMLAVASDRFPRTGAVAISIMGGIGMMSAGLIGAPGLGYFKDRYAGEELKQADAALYDTYKAEKPSQFLVFPEATGLDGKKLGEVKAAVIAKTATAEQIKVQQADIRGDRRTLVADSFIPATMAVIYLCLLLYFASIGGYKPVHIDGERLTGGVEAPVR